MASIQQNGLRLHNAQMKAYGVVKALGTPERRGHMRSQLVREDAMPSPNYEIEMHAFNLELVAGLAEIVQAQERRIARLEGAAPVAAASSDEEAHTSGDERPVLSEELRELLANAGYADDQAVREASDEDLLGIKGVGPAKLEEIRAATAATEEA